MEGHVLQKGSCVGGISGGCRLGEFILQIVLEAVYYKTFENRMR